MRRFVLVFAALLMLLSLAAAQTPITDIQFVEDPASDDASPLAGSEVTIHGWITFEPMSAGGNKFFVADAAGAWNGIYVYSGDNDYNLGFGWEVEVTGTVEEYNGITELNASAGSLTVVDDVVDWTALPAACAYTAVTMADLAGGAATAEQYESVLISLDDEAGAYCSNTDAGYGEWEISDGTNTVVVDNPQDAVYGYAYTPVENHYYEWFRGILNYSYGAYKIVPEIAFDIKIQEDTNNGIYTPVAWFQQVRPMDMTMQEDENGDPFTHDESYASEQRYGDGRDPYTVTVHGLVSGPSDLYYAGAGIKFIMYDFDNAADGDGNSLPWSSVLCYDSDSTAFPNLMVGHEILFSGYVSEYVTGSSHMTEMFITSPATVESQFNPVPIPTMVTTGDIRTPETAEQWGNVFVQINDAIVVHDNLNYEIMAIDDDLNDDLLAIKVDDDSDSLDNTTYVTPPIGTMLTSVDGWIYHHYGTLSDDDGTDWVYKIVPQGPSNIVVGEGPPGFLSATRNPAVPSSADGVVVTAEISDNSSVESASVFYREGITGDFTEIAMTNTGGLEWEATIPAMAAGTNIWYYLSATDDDEEVTTSPSDIEASLYGYWVTEVDGLPSVYEIQYTPFAAGNSPYANLLVTVEGIVTTESEIYDSQKGYYIQGESTDAGFWSICADIPAEMGQPAPGTKIRITGTVDETGAGNANYPSQYPGNTRIINIVSYEAISNEASEVFAVDAATVNANIEAYESVMCEFNNLEITSINQYDWTFTDDSGEEFLLDDDLIYQEMVDTVFFDHLEVGDTIDMLRGIVTYTFGSWKVSPRNNGDISGLSVDNNAVTTLPGQFYLSQNYPNPFNPSTTLNYGLPTAAPVKLVVYNSLGRMVETLVNDVQNAGNYKVLWNATNYASGAYFVRLEAEGHTQIRKMMLVK